MYFHTHTQTNSITKRILAVILCAVVFAGIIPVTVFGADSLSNLHITYDNLNDRIVWDEYPNAVKYTVCVRTPNSTNNILTVSSTSARVDLEEILAGYLSTYGMLTRTTMPSANVGFYVNPLTNDMGINGSYDILVKVTYNTTDLVGGATTKTVETQKAGITLDYTLKNGHPGDIRGLRITRPGSGTATLTWDDTRRDGGVKRNCSYKVTVSFTVDGVTYYWNGTSIVAGYSYISTAVNTVNLSRLEQEFISRNIRNTLLNVNVEATLTDTNGYKYITSANENLYINGGVNENPYKACYWGDETADPFRIAYSIDALGGIPDFDNYYYELQLYKTISNTNHNKLYTYRLEDNFGRGTLDLSNKVIENGNGIYYVILNKRYRSSGEIHSSYESWERNFNVADYLYFTSQSPANNSVGNYYAGAKLNISYTVAQLPQWMLNAGVTVKSPSISIYDYDYHGIAVLYEDNIDARSWSDYWILPENRIGERLIFSYNVYIYSGNGTRSESYLHSEFDVEVVENNNPDGVSLSFTVTKPVMGKHPSFSLGGSGIANAYFSSQLVWQEKTGIGYYSWRNLTSSDVFRSGVTYRPLIKLTPKGTLVPKIKSVFINSAAADTGYFSGNTVGYAVNMMVEDTYYPIYIGVVQVGDGNRHDVLNDGGSVKYHLEGELQSEDHRYCNTLELNNANITTDMAHSAEGEEMSAIRIEDDIHILLIGENHITNNYDTVNGITFWDQSYESFWGNGSLDISVSNNYRTAIYGSAMTLSLYDNVTVTASGSRAVYTDFNYDIGEINLYDNSSLYTYGYRTDDDKDLYTIEAPYIYMYNNSYLYTEHEWNEPAVLSWSTSFAGFRTDVIIRGIRITHDGQVNREWTDLECINGDYKTTPQEEDYRALEIRASLENRHTVSGTLDSYMNYYNVSLCLRDQNTNVLCNAVTVTDRSGTYSITGVRPGSYTMTVEKKGHVTRTYYITVGNDDVTKNVTICRFGDSNGDNELDDNDYQTMVNRALLADRLTPEDTSRNGNYAFVCLDMNCDGVVDVLDCALLERSIH